MRIIVCLVSFASFVLVNLSCHEPTPEPRDTKVVPGGFVPLFNGINLDGWKVRQSENKDWQVLEGVIDCDPHMGRGDRNLWTAKSYSDFELLADWRIKESPYINRAAKIVLADGCPPEKLRRPYHCWTYANLLYTAGSIILAS